MEFAKHLAGDPAYRQAHFGVIDFEGTTPTGRSPEPIEVAVAGLRHHDGQGPQPSGFRWEALMRPPAYAPVTPSVTAQTGIRPEDCAGRPSAGEVLARLDAELPSGPTLLVAHNASVEAGFLYRYREHCPRMALLPVLDTIAMAKAAHSGLPGYSLDALIGHFRLDRPTDRHRAMADVDVTAALFIRLLTDLVRAGTFGTLADLVKRCARRPRAAQPVQLTFG